MLAPAYLANKATRSVSAGSGAGRSISGCKLLLLLKAIKVFKRVSHHLLGLPMRALANHNMRRSLDNEFPTAMRVRAAGALHRALAFQDVRQRVYGVSQSVISKLADLLRNEPPEGRHQQGREKERRDRPGARSQEWVSKGAGWCEAEKMCKVCNGGHLNLLHYRSIGKEGSQMLHKG